MVRIKKSQLAALRNASIETIRTQAQEIVAKATQESTIFDADTLDKVPCFDLDGTLATKWCTCHVPPLVADVVFLSLSRSLSDVVVVVTVELVLGHVLGRGGFCAVRELLSVKVTEDDDLPKQSPFKSLFCCREKTLNPAALLGDDKDSDDVDSVTEKTSDAGGVPREKLANYASRVKKGGTSKYAVKQVNGELQYSDKVSYLKAIVDIELEAKYMTALSHPNIARIRGLSNPNPSNGETFLILDRLKETMAKKFQEWLRRHRQCTGITGAVVGSKAKKEDLLVERLVAAHNVADALDYLHSKGVIFRDCKPDNIGFCGHGVLKLFDFGLAREVQEKDRVKNSDLYHLTGLTGAIRYMAPEVGLRNPYNFKADVYSWSQLMWYILELEPPLGVYTPQMFCERVFKRGTRPAVMESWPKHMAPLMKQCWSANISERPTFKEVKEKLGVILLPYNSKKLIPNRFGEPDIPGGTKNKGDAASYVSDTSVIGEGCRNNQHTVVADECCDEDDHGHPILQTSAHC
jgi:serine/threonine protein kinase